MVKCFGFRAKGLGFGAGFLASDLGRRFGLKSPWHRTSDFGLRVWACFGIRIF